MADMRKRQVLGILEEIYGRVRYLGRKGKSRECKKSSQRV